jgi:hypothetical protein
MQKGPPIQRRAERKKQLEKKARREAHWNTRYEPGALVFTRVPSSVSYKDALSLQSLVFKSIRNNEHMLKYINPIFQLHSDYSDLPEVMKKMICYSRRPVVITNTLPPFQQRKLDILFDTGCGRKSTISQFLVQRYFKKFQPVYYPVTKFGRGVAKQYVRRIGTIVLSITCQHDQTGVLYTASVCFEIMDSSPNIFILSNKDCVTSFRDVFNSMITTHTDYETHVQNNIPRLCILTRSKAKQQPSPDNLIKEVATLSLTPSISHDTTEPIAIQEPLPVTVEPITRSSSDGDEEGGQWGTVSDSDDINNETPTVVSKTTQDDDMGATLQEIAAANEFVKREVQRLHEGDRRKFHHSARTMYFDCKKQWPGNEIPFKYFNDYVLACAFCQKARALMNLRFHRLSKTLKNPLYRRSAIGIDVLYVGHEDYRGNTLVIIIVQFFTRHVFGYPTHTYEAETVVDALMTYYSLFGLYDIMASDPGSNLLAEAVRLFNAQCNVEHRVSMVDEHGSSGVENQGCKKIIQHLQHLVAHEACIHKWSAPTVLGYAIMKINSSNSREINMSPFKALFGEPDEAWTRCVLPPFVDPPTSSKYLKELWSIQRDITVRAMEWQQALHDKRVAKTPLNLQKRYAPGDMVLRFRQVNI